MSKRKREDQILQENHLLSDAHDPAALQADDDLRTLLLEQRRELAAAQTVESDLRFAYHLQMLEAVNASLFLSQNGDVASSSNPTFSFDDVPETTAAQLLADEISNFERQLFDRRVAEDEMRKIRNDLNRRVHDRAFAREILNVPDEEWEEIGDNIEKPFKEGSASAKGLVQSNGDYFRIHVKGLTSAETAEDAKRETFFGGIGVAIFDTNDVLIFEASKGVVGGEMNGEVVEVKALIEGLHFAAVFGLKRVVIFSDSDLLYRCVRHCSPLPYKHLGKWLVVKPFAKC